MNNLIELYHNMFLIYTVQKRYYTLKKKCLKQNSY